MASHRFCVFHPITMHGYKLQQFTVQLQHKYESAIFFPTYTNSALLITKDTVNKLN
jgi:hypothetical protein